MANTFLDREDLVKKYAARRKEISEEEIDDLLDCVLSFVKKEAKNENNYAIRLGKLGFLHKDFRKERQGRKYPHSNVSTVNNMLIDIFTNNPSTKHPLIRTDIVKRYYKGKTIEEIQDIQNNAED